MLWRYGILLFAALMSCSARTTPCSCSRSYEPVCGSDGLTYNNECILGCSAARLLHQGECGAQPACNCGRAYKPVCGSDGKTYDNDCELNCATAQDSGLSIANYGACAPQPDCVCPDDYAPVCGSDGKTYSNDCQLNCATAQDSQLRIAQYAACASDQLSCNCGRAYKPVCGSDGKTYDNDCELNCATAQDSTLSIAQYGPCEAQPDVAPPCVCPLDHKPVCGSDGKTYSNSCVLNCATARDSGLRITRQGSCLTVNVVDIN